MDVVMLSRIQFAVTVAYHFLFVPLSIGIGMILVFAERRYYKSGLAEDKAGSDFWIKVFTATFAVGVATGITMEFAFGTNWAAYSRFVGDIFGAPLAAEGLFAFFLESTFLGILLFGRNRVSKKFFYVSTWLVWCGSMLSALWIIIANSWMQSPAGFKVVVENGQRKAVLTNFFEAAFNPTMLPRYAHTIDAVLMTGGFVAMAMGAYYLRRGTHTAFAKQTLGIGLVLASVFTVLMLFAGHWQAVSVVENQPTKIAAFEGHWQDGPIPLGLIGFLDTSGKKTISLEVPGGVNLLVGDLARTKAFPGLNSFAEKDLPPLQLSYQTYHLMIMLWGLMVLVLLVAWFMQRRGSLEKSRGMLTLLMWAPILPMLAIQLGWAAAEVGRQPWIVWGQMRTLDAISKAVPAGEVATTLLLFVLFYTLIYIAWLRIVIGFIKKGPEVDSGATAGVREPVPTPVGSASGAATAFSSDEGGVR